MMTVVLALLIGAALGSFLDKPPCDLASLLEPKSVLTQINQDTSEEALIQVLLASSRLTVLAEDRLRQAVRNLGAEQYKDRMRAKRLLKVAGATALPFLEDAAQSDDPEVRISAAELLKDARKEASEARENGDAEYVRKLMAVRLLETTKSTKALPALKKLAADERPTLAAAAENASSVIEGAVPRRPLVGPIMQDVVQRIPSDAAFVCLIDLTSGSQATTIDSLFATLSKDPSLKGMTSMTGMAIGQQQLKDEVLKILGKTGNVRVDAVCAVISQDFAETGEGYMGFVIKGLFEPGMMDSFLKQSVDNVYDRNGTTVFYASDIAISRLDRNTIVIAVSDREDGRQVDPLVSAFSGKVEAVSHELLVKRHPIVIPALEPVVSGNARVSIGGAFSEAQQAILKREVVRDLDRLRKRLKADNTIRNQVDLAITASAEKLISATSLSTSISEGKPLSVVIVMEAAEDADELRSLLVEADRLVRERLKVELSEVNHGKFPGMKEMFGDISKPYISVSQNNATLTVEIQTSTLSSLFLGL